MGEVSTLSAKKESVMSTLAERYNRRRDNSLVDTTIMASAGAQCNHVDHVATQLPYAVTVAGISFVCYLIAPLIDNWFITFPIAVALTVGTLFVIRAVTRRRAGAVQCDAARV